MKNILVMGTNNQVGRSLLKQSQDVTNSELKFTFIDNDKVGFESADQLAPKLQSADILVINTVGWDADYMLDAVMDAIEMQSIKLERIIFRSVAGVDDEYPLDKIQVVAKNQPEFIKQQQYAGKLVDESEIPYTILRPTNIEETANQQYQLIKEGQPMQTAKNVSAVAVAQVIIKAVLTDDLVNQSIGICG